MPALSLEGAFWRRMARMGARGPEWFARYSPPAIGVAICVFAPRQRDAIARNLRRVCGSRSPLRETLDVARTFANYASCLSEVLAGESPRGRAPGAVAVGECHVDDALADGRGVLFATAHTGGWDVVGRMVSRRKGRPVMLVRAPERDGIARAIHDDGRTEAGVVVIHAGDDPLAALPLARHLRQGGIVALQVDRVPRAQRARTVQLFDEASQLPEGPLRLSALTGAPIVPIFAARTGHRQYRVVAYPPIRVPRAAGDEELGSAAQRLADALENFVRSHPTQWFHFRED